MKMTIKEFLEVGERIWNLIRMFNIREGLKIDDETLPDRAYKDPISRGIAAGQKLEREQVEAMLKEYYALRKWDERGIPENEKLKQLKLDFAILLMDNSNIK